jgi:hypothetical protein
VFSPQKRAKARAEFHESAKAELAFLISLLPEDERKHYEGAA